MSKSNVKKNPLPGKTFNPNVEPWLTYRELLEEGRAISRGYQRVGLNFQNGSQKNEEEAL